MPRKDLAMETKNKPIEQPKLPENPWAEYGEKEKPTSPANDGDGGIIQQLKQEGWPRE